MIQGGGKKDIDSHTLYQIHYWFLGPIFAARNFYVLFLLPLTLSVEKTSSEFFQLSIFLSHCIFEALGAGGQR